MDKQTKYLLVGATLAALIFLGGYLTSIYDNSQLSSLVEKCKAEAAQPKTSDFDRIRSNVQLMVNKGAPETDIDGYLATEGYTPEKFKGEMIRIACDPDELRVGKTSGIQKQIVESLSTVGHTFDNAKIIALLVFFLFGLPYAWYFLLRRIRELRDAFAGK